jgi:hypothetical protein
MGGYGSTRWRTERTRQETAPLLLLDAATLRTMGAFTPTALATHEWTDWRGEPAGAIQTYTHADLRALTLIYRTRGRGEDWQERRERIWLEATPCPFGGERLWLTCPSCRSRRRVLYCADGWFRCRACHDLAYSSTREDAHDRSLRRTRELQGKLGMNTADVFAIPEKPAGMHWETYSRIAIQIHQENMFRLGIHEAEFQKLHARVDRLLASEAGK